MTSQNTQPAVFNRLLLTGAAGGLGRVLRKSLKPFTKQLRLSDITNLTPSNTKSEEIVICNLADKVAVDALVAGCDAIVHMGGVSVERPFEEVLEANIKGVFHIYEGARRHHVKRIVFASSNHVIGFYKQSERIDTNVKRRPDGYYGLSKSFGEDVAQFYFERYGIETVSLRIGSSLPEPKDRRMLHTWLSSRDLTELIRCALFTPNVAHTVIYGVSNNRDLWWDNHAAAHLGFIAQDSAEVFRSKVDNQPAPAPNDPSAIYQGGAFTVSGPFENKA